MVFTTPDAQGYWRVVVTHVGYIMSMIKAMSVYVFTLGSGTVYISLASIQS
jgi:hypothetical protein